MYPHEVNGPWMQSLRLCDVNDLDCISKWRPINEWWDPTLPFSLTGLKTSFDLRQ